MMLEVDSYFDITLQQETAGKPRIDVLMAWHKREALPAYIKQLRALAAGVEQGFDTAQVTSTFDWGMGELRRVGQYAAPQQAEFLSTLSDKQIAYLQKKLNKDNVKYRKEWLAVSLDDAKELRFDKYLTWVERIYGNFGNEQKMQLRKLSDARSFNPKQGYDERVARQNGFVAMVKAMSKNEAQRNDTRLTSLAQTQIADFTTSLEKPSDTAAVNRRELIQLIAATSQLATPDQRLAAKATLLGYADTFENISRGR